MPMREFQDIATWIGSIKSAEAPYPALSEWLDLESRRAVKRNWLAGGALFVCAVGALLTFLGVGLTSVALASWGDGIRYQFLFLFAISLAAMPSLVATTLIRQRLLRRNLQSVDPEVARAVETLRLVRRPRRLVRKLGKNGALELNEGAALFFRCRMSLLSDAWNSQAPTEPWGEARTAMLKSMEAAMGRLALCVVKKRSSTRLIVG